MPSFNTNVLPTSTGLNLGASNQQWNLWANLLNGNGPVNYASVSNAWAATIAFVGNSVISVQRLTLAGNVTSSTFVGLPGILITIIAQDATGGRTFAWPAQFLNPQPPDLAPNAITSQIFYFDGTSVIPLSPGVTYP